jgi:hypothetical protein
MSSSTTFELLGKPNVYDFKLSQRLSEVVRIISIEQCSTLTTSVIYWSEFLATDPKVPGLIPGATRFSEK